ncbi:hypothetical protein DEO72_LG3g2225 [Vigna unguiculata]|uniref:Uncharacterized protein n=1 Tax=Vigna unguiculata TaxID=3917 RepID=A0A4D6LH94_VIGUN|nr:hypothetical protein DEO72_LG3g2225 [Vigna unguiculata]
MWRLVTRMVLPGGGCLTEALKGACRLATGGDRQAIWNQIVPGDACHAPSDFGYRARSCGGFYTVLDGGFDVMLC